MNEAISKELRSLTRGATMAAAGMQQIKMASNNLASLFDTGRTWTLDFIPSATNSDKRFITNDKLTVSRAALMLTVSPVHQLPSRGGEMLYVAEYSEGSDRMLFNRLICLVCHTPSGIRVVGGGVGEVNASKTRLDYAGRPLPHHPTVIRVKIALGKQMTVTYREFVKTVDLTGETAVNGRIGIQLGGLNPLFGVHHHTTVELFS